MVTAVAMLLHSTSQYTARVWCSCVFVAMHTFYLLVDQHATLSTLVPVRQRTSHTQSPKLTTKKQRSTPSSDAALVVAPLAFWCCSAGESAHAPLVFFHCIAYQRLGRQQTSRTHHQKPQSFFTSERASEFVFAKYHKLEEGWD